MIWLELVVAGIFETVWATTMKYSEGFTKPGFSIATLVAMTASFLLLARATKTLPLSIAYPIWTGIGAVGSILVGVILFKDSLSPLTWIFVGFLLVGIVGIKLTTGH
ncbi:Quaternary ammonium compound-resistance protein SugE [Pediococcus damnosus]|uniref:Quaternary ammonium compound-resistance protein SugE n=1 Tax=Pediococcus damnosus TaxID=51663 RepID=A0A0R2HPZ1_9LACO|nr:multidrug efflux SMR transporter [Pediococcus damnosus]AMV63084.1 Quaternary ammonium compound-resistance protein SugE [Pediococcus damnosus]AMV64761.1 Quaternary ammonium compound-resistance protein SugE [Pediococcus damnosus]AMV67025.1 Quaternary ammonium compound-resistance protein SugE [Pediococcus damnosus]AMV69375.1 Quaternary ammonium compound-resistance protein SugE [Pediococcus damnosus]KJU73420.1 supressor protein SugE [Pediococcus damnosus LMG 28219]